VEQDLLGNVADLMLQYHYFDYIPCLKVGSNDETDYALHPIEGNY
jgi:hypothetical protein